jgi:hypothetical protein
VLAKRQNVCYNVKRMKKGDIMIGNTLKLTKIDTVSTLKWVATVITLFGALFTSLGIDPLNIILLNIGSFLFFIWGTLIKDKAMISVNAGLLFIYFFGLILRT